MPQLSKLTSQITSPTSGTVGIGAGAVTLQDLPFFFAIDAYGNLLSCSYGGSPATPNWYSLGIPPGMPLADRVAIASVPLSGYAYVFVTGQDSSIWCNMNVGVSGQWSGMATPSSSVGAAQMIGAAIIEETAFLFVVGTDGNLWLTSTALAPAWINAGAPTGVTIAGGLGATTNEVASTILVCVAGSDNSMQSCVVASDGTFTWQSASSQTGTTIEPAGVGICDANGVVYDFFLDDNNNTQCISSPQSYWEWDNLQTPPSGICQSIIGANINYAGLPIVYVTDPHGALYCNVDLNEWTALVDPNGPAPILAAVGVTSTSIADLAFIIDQNKAIWCYTSSNWTQLTNPAAPQ